MAWQGRFQIAVWKLIFRQPGFQTIVGRHETENLVRLDEVALPEPELVRAESVFATPGSVSVATL
jgi:hypothetical protein